MKEIKNTEFPQNWDFFFCRVEDKPASIRVNLALYDLAPIEGFTHRVWFALKMLNPTESGFSSQEEYPILCDIEDAVLNALESLGAIAAGTLKSNGFLELYAYVKNPKDVEETCQNVMKNFPDYQSYCNVVDESEWDTYFDFLYPDAYSYQSMMNRKVFHQLQEQGDKPDIPREIDHWLYFPSEENMQKYISKVQQLGYKVLSTEKIDKQTSNPFQLNISRVNTAFLKDIDNYVWELMELANPLNGIYDGWGCTINK